MGRLWVWIALGVLGGCKKDSPQHVEKNAEPSIVTDHSDLYKREERAPSSKLQSKVKKISQVKVGQVGSPAVPHPLVGSSPAPIATQSGPGPIGSSATQSGGGLIGGPATQIGPGPIGGGATQSGAKASQSVSTRVGGESTPEDLVDCIDTDVSPQVGGSTPVEPAFKRQRTELFKDLWKESPNAAPVEAPSPQLVETALNLRALQAHVAPGRQPTEPVAPSSPCATSHTEGIKFREESDEDNDDDEEQRKAREQYWRLNDPRKKQGKL